MGFLRGHLGRCMSVPDAPAGGAGAPPEAAAPIDPAAIARLRELDPDGKLGVLSRVLHAYQGSLERLLGELAHAHDQGDVDRMARAAHTLKSSSASVGATGLSQRCAQVEHALRAQRLLPEAATLEALVHEGRQVQAAVAAMLAA